MPCPSGLIAWWPGDGSGTNLAGSGNGTLANGATFAAGYSRQAFSLDGVDDYVDIGHLQQLDNATAITVLAWLKKTANANPYAGFVGKYDNSPHANHVNTFLLYNGEGTFQNKGCFYVVFEDKDYVSVGGTRTIPIGTWTQIAATWRNTDGQIAIYKNGVLEATATNGIGKRLEAHRAYTAKIGEWGVVRNANYKFRGEIDEVAVFSRALSSNEIAGIYAAGTNGMCQDALPPRLLTWPTNQFVALGSNVTLTVTASGTEPFNYQWLFHGSNLPGATLSTLDLDPATLADTGPYSVLVSNAYGMATSPAAVLTVVPPPVITAHPQSQARPLGYPVTFSVSADSPALLSYQWLKDGTNLPSATSSNYTIASIQSNHLGTYVVLVSNLAGAVISSNAMLAVTNLVLAPNVAMFDGFEHGLYSGWNTYDGAFSVADGVFQIQSTAWANDARAVVLNTNWSDYSLDLDFKFANTQGSSWPCSVLFRVAAISSGIDAGRYYQISLGPSRVGFERMNYTGSAQWLANVAHSITPHVWHHLRLVVVGDVGTVYIDSTPVLSYAGFSHYRTGGIGLKSINSALNVFDNVQVKGNLVEFKNPESFELGWGDWYSDHVVWQIGRPTHGPPTNSLGFGAFSYTNCAATLLGGNYSRNSNGRLITPTFTVPAVNPGDLLVFRFWQWYQYGAGDSGKLQVSVRAGANWFPWETIAIAAPTNGSSGTWQQFVADLTQYQGQDVRVGFLQTANNDSSVGAGWYIDNISINHFIPQPISLGSPFTGHLPDVEERDYYSVRVPAGGHLTVTLTDLDGIGANEIYLKHGSLPSAGDFDYHFSDFGAANQQVYVPDARPGYWFILVRGSDVPAGGSAYTIVAVHGTGVILDKVTPGHYGAAGGAVLTITGAGFIPTSTVELVRDGQILATATEVVYRSGRHLQASLDLAGITPGPAAIRVTSGESSELAPFEIREPLPAELRARLVLPSSVGYHMPATIWVEYENIGGVALPAPLLVVSAKQGERAGAILHPGGSYQIHDGRGMYVIPLSGKVPAPQARGFWTSAMPEGYANTIQFLASGSVPGLIQPGEKGRFPIYWAGWQKPWDFSYPPINFTVGVVHPGNPEPLDWSEMKDTMRPPAIDAGTWDALWAAFTATTGNTWGGYVGMLQNNANYLGRLGLSVVDVSDLLAFEFAQANSLNVVRTLASATDAVVEAPGLALRFQRRYGQSITVRHALGAFGRGWSHNWDYALRFETDGTIRMAGPGGSMRTYQPDSRPNRPYFSMNGDFAVFSAVAGGYRQVEAGGLARVFDAQGRLAYVEDTSGNRITCTHTAGRLTRLDHSAGQFFEIGWNGHGRIDSITDPAGRATVFDYDGTGQYLTDVLNYDGLTVGYAYETAGALARRHALRQITLPGGALRVFNWGADGRLESTHRNGGAERISFHYDSAGTVYVSDAFGNTSAYALDHNGMLVRASDPQGDTIALGYDFNYQLESIVDPAGLSHHYTYDTRGNLTRMADPMGHTTRLSYSGPFNRLTGLVDAKGNTTRYGYNSRGNLTSILYPDASEETWSHDAAGQPREWKNRRGTPITYDYDAAGRLTAKVYPDESRTEYEWNARGNLITTRDARGTTRYSYDEDDFLERIDYPGGHWLEYSYDEAGRRATLTNDLGQVTRYHYDTAGRLSHLTDTAGDLVVRYEYDAAGRLHTKTLGNGVHTTYGYNAAWELVDLSNRMPDGTILSQFEYEYDPRGRRVAMTSTYGLGADPRAAYQGRWEYEYDDLGQLTAWSDPTGRRVEYEYDALGNRISESDAGAVTAYSANNLNQYTGVGGAEFDYDDDGNLVREDRADGSWTAYTYNDENRLVAVSNSAGQNWLYTYDALGHRVGVDDNGAATTHVIDPFGWGNVVGSIPDGPAGQRLTHVHGFGLVSRQPQGDAPDYYTFDAIGSVQDITGTDASVLHRAVYEPFGGTMLAAGPLESMFGAFGEWGIRKGAGDLLHMRAREYSSDAGRFLADDPIGLNGGQANLRCYVRNNPVMIVDPSGLIREYHPEFGEYEVEYYENRVGNPERGYQRDGRIYINTAFPDWIQESSKYHELVHLRQPRSIWTSTAQYEFEAYYREIEAFRKNNGYGAPNPERERFLRDLLHELEQQLNALRDDPFWRTQPVAPADPNLKTGPAGYGAAGFIPAGSLMNYRVDFENLPEATASAHMVTIHDPLNAHLDWRTFTVTEVGWGDIVLNVPPGSHRFEATTPMTIDGVAFEVEVEIGINLGSGEVSANFYSLDSWTGLPPEGGVGLLPAEDGTGRGMGWFSYTIEQMPGLPTGTAIRNIAYITFNGAQTFRTDLSDPEDPNSPPDPNKQALVTIDADPPSSSVVLIPPEVATRFEVQWSGEDGAGAGIVGYDIQFAEVPAEGALNWKGWQLNTPLASAFFEGELGNTYAFRCRARDGVGYMEDWPAVADALTTVTTQFQTNRPPVITPISDQTVFLGGTLNLEVLATDPDEDQILRNTLLISPAGMVITDTNLVRWTPTAEQLGSSEVTVQVTDNGQPPLSATNSFKVNVIRLEVSWSVSDETLTLTFTTRTGHQYVVQYTDDLGTGAWRPLGAPLSGTGQIQTADLPIETEEPRRFYRIVETP